VGVAGKKKEDVEKTDSSDNGEWVQKFLINK
jgi:hypothetical protein